MSYILLRFFKLFCRVSPASEFPDDELLGETAYDFLEANLLANRAPEPVGGGAWETGFDGKKVLENPQLLRGTCNPKFRY